MSSEGSVSSESSRVHQFGLYRSIDARTEEFLRLSRKRQIRQGCACAAVSTAITVAVVVVVISVYEFSLSTQVDTENSFKRNWFTIINDTSLDDHFETKFVKSSIDKTTLTLLPILLKALKKNIVYDKVFEDQSSSSPVYDEGKTTEYNLEENIIARRWFQLPKLYSITYKTSPVTYYKSPTQSIKYYTKVRKIRNYQRMINYVDKMINEKVYVGSTQPLFKTPVAPERLTLRTPPKQNLIENTQYESTRTQTANINYGTKMSCECPLKLSKLFYKFLSAIQNLLPPEKSTNKKITKNCHHHKSLGSNNTVVKEQQNETHALIKSSTLRTNNKMLELYHPIKKYMINKEIISTTTTAATETATAAATTTTAAATTVTAAATTGTAVATTTAAATTVTAAATTGTAVATTTQDTFLDHSLSLTYDKNQKYDVSPPIINYYVDSTESILKMPTRPMENINKYKEILSRKSIADIFKPKTRRLDTITDPVYDINEYDDSLFNTTTLDTLRNLVKFSFLELKDKISNLTTQKNLISLEENEIRNITKKHVETTTKSSHSLLFNLKKIYATTDIYEKGQIKSVSNDTHIPLPNLFTLDKNNSSDILNNSTEHKSNTIMITATDENITEKNLTHAYFLDSTENTIELPMEKRKMGETVADKLTWEEIENKHVQIFNSMIPTSRPTYLEIYQRNDWKHDAQDYDFNVLNNYDVYT